MWRELQRYRKLSPDARRMFQRAVFLLPRIAISLRVRGFGKTRDALQQKLRVPNQPQRSDESASDTLQLACRMISAASRHRAFNPTCLAESLALWVLLKEQGIDSTLRIGVRKSSRRFEAHAWVEHDGIALNQREERHHHYSAFEAPLAGAQGERP
jgi:hypothetical protein